MVRNYPGSQPNSSAWPSASSQSAGAAPSVTATSKSLQSHGRRLSASPSPDGALAIYTPHKYSRSSRIHSAEVRILDLKTGNSTPFSKDPNDREPSWLGESNQVIWLKDVAFGATELWISDAEGSEINCHCTGRIDARVANLKLHRIDECTIALTFSCPTTVDGALFNPAKGTAAHVSNSIWYTTLSKRAYENNAFKVRYIVWPSRPSNALKSTGLHSPLSPSPDACNDFDVTSTGLSFIARDPSIGAPDPLRTELYYIPLNSFSNSAPPRPQLLSIPGFEGSSSHPVFSPNGKSIAFLKKQARRDENDRNRLIVINDLDKPMPSTGDLPQRASREGWHLSPQSVSWSDDGTELGFDAIYGRCKLSSRSTKRENNCAPISRFANNASLTRLTPPSSPIPAVLSTPSSPLNGISNLSGLNPPPDFGINLVFDSAQALSPLGVYNIALDTIYRLSLHPWSGTISRSVFFSLPQYTEQVLFEPKQLGRGAVRELQTGFAILALYAGVVAMTPPTRNLFYELQVTISKDRVAVGRCTIRPTPPTLAETQRSDRNRTVMPQQQINSSSDSSLYTSSNPLTTNTGSFTDPEDPNFRLSYTFTNARLNSKDVFLAAIDGVAAAARNNPGKRCAQLSAASPGAGSRRGVVMNFSALKHPRRVLFTYQYASRAMVLLTRIMQEGNRWEAVGFYLEHGGLKFGEGFVRGTVAGDVAVV